MCNGSVVCVPYLCVRSAWLSSNWCSLSARLVCCVNVSRSVFDTTILSSIARWILLTLADLSHSSLDTSNFRIRCPKSLVILLESEEQCFFRSSIHSLYGWGSQLLEQTFLCILGTSDIIQWRSEQTEDEFVFAFPSWFWVNCHAFHATWWSRSDPAFT